MQIPSLGANLRRLRVARGLSQVDLAKAANLSRIAVGNIEAGGVTPRIDTVTRLADALGVPIVELLKASRSLEAVRFRALKRMRSREDVVARVAQWLDDYTEVERLVGESRRERWSRLRDGIRGAQTSSAAAFAAKTRKVLGLDPSEPIRDICGLLEDHGVKLFPLDLASDDFFGLSVGERDGGPAVVVNVWPRISVERWIFSAVHEFAHLLLHLDAFDIRQSAEDDAEEKDANQFASHFLMPADVFSREWEEACGLPFIDRVLKVKRIFHVSYKAVLYRVAETGTPNVWARFKAEYKLRYGRSLGNNDEPLRLTKAEFQEDRLARLVRLAVDGRMISVERAAAVLDIPVDEMNRRSREWRALGSGVSPKRS